MNDPAPGEFSNSVDRRQLKRRAVMSLIGTGVISLALTAYQDHELVQLDAWHSLETARCEVVEGPFSCSGAVNREFDDRYYPMLRRATVFQVAGSVCLVLGVCGAGVLWRQRRALVKLLRKQRESLDELL